MYELDLIKSTKLAKKLGGPPIFHDGFLHRVTVDKDIMTLDVKLLSQSNPLLKSDTNVLLKLNNIKRFTMSSRSIKNALLVIHDLDIRKVNDHLHLILESTDGTISEVEFETIELIEA